MPATASPPRRTWLRVLLWAGSAVLLLALAVAAVAYFGVRYLASGEIKRFEDVIGLRGGSVAFRSLTFDGWDTYPYVGVTLTDLVVEAPGEAPAAPLLAVDSLAVPLHVEFWDRRRAPLLGLTLRGGGFHVRKDSSGQTGLGRLLGGGGESAVDERTREAAEGSYLRIDPAAEFLVEDLEVSYAAVGKGTEVAGRLRRLRVDSFRYDGGDFASALSLDVRMHALQFDGKQGAYLREQDVAGVLHLAVADRVLTGQGRALRFGPNSIDLDADFHLDRDTVSTIRLAMPEGHVDSARAILAPGIRRAIDAFDVRGPFASVTEIRSSFAPGDKPLVDIGIRLRGNTARVDRETFRDTYLDARFVNRAADATGGRRGVQFFIDTVRTDYLGFDMRAARAVVRADAGESPRLIASGELRGPAAAVSRAVAGRDFVFTRGQVLAKAAVDGPADDVMALLDGALIDGRFTDADIVLPAAGVTLPLKRLDVDKQGDVTAFDLLGGLPGRAGTYRMAGELTGIGYLLGTDPDAEVTTDVRVGADRLAWTDVVNLLGAGGKSVDRGSVLDPVVPDDALASSPPPTPTPARTDAEEKSALKATLRLVEQAFSPTLDLAVDTLDYYALRLTDFRTGLHFEPGPTLVLEHTTFDVDTGAVALDARLGIGPERRTGFAFEIEAEHLDLERLAAGVDYFGIALLGELQRLPNDVDLSIAQRGLLDAVDGIVFPQADGSIRLESNGALPFAAQVDFEPDRPGVEDVQTTRVALQGSPELFNTFFATEDFFFRGGDFDFRMGYGGIVPSLRRLIDENRMQLRVTDASVDYRSAGIRVPLEHLDVEMQRDTAALDLRIEDARFGQEITVTGHANNLSEVVLGDSGKDFSSDVTVASPRLVWTNVSRLIEKLGEMEEPAPLTARTAPPRGLRRAFAKTGSAQLAPAVAALAPDTPALTPALAPAAPLELRRTVKEVFTRFRPRATVEIGELQLPNAFAIRDVSSTVSMGPDDVLYVDTTGFSYREGRLDLAGKLDLADLTLTPFRAVLHSDRLAVTSLLEGLDYLDVPELADAEQLDGELRLRLDVSGAVTGGEEAAALLTASTCGTLDVRLDNLRLSGVAPIDRLAGKMKMRKRLDTLRFAPIDAHVRIDGNEFYLARTQLQSNGFQAYVEGTVRTDSASSLLVSVPLLPNLRRDTDVVPEKEDFEERRFKVHVELSSESGGEGLETKLRLRRKKWARRMGVE